jgi:serine/threonine protein phosphatase PrpC
VIDLERVKTADLSDLNAALFVLLSETPSMKLGH